MHYILIWWIAFSVFVHDQQSVRNEILRGLPSIPVLGTPGTMSVWGTDAFPVVIGKNKAHPIAVAARYGKGRFFAIAHGAYVGGVMEGSPSPMMQQVLHWVGGYDNPSIGVVNNEPSSWGDADVLMFGQNMQLTPENETALLAWIHQGGGVIASACPWGWVQITKKDLKSDLSQNRVMAVLGMQYGGGYSDASGDGIFIIGDIPSETHANVALQTILDTGSCSSVGADALLYAIQTIPSTDNAFVSCVKQVVEGAKITPPSKDTPMASSDVIGRLYVSMFSSQWKQRSPESIEAASGSELFPGSVDAAIERLSDVKLHLDHTIVGWQSTGLYLNPGEVLKLQVIDGDVQGWNIQIGCHTDTLWHKQSWQRWPEITHNSPIKQDMNMATPWGGLVYFLAGQTESDITISLSGVIEAPFFDVEHTDLDWFKVRMYSAPWAELKGKHMIITVPSDAVRMLDNPLEVTTFWDEVMLSHCDLAGIPVPKRLERFVADQQISAGYMHSGYPVMTWLDVATPENGKLAPVVDVDQLKKQGSWGHFHELGHNLQRSSWTFAGTGEVTCNLFSLHAGEVLCGIEPWENPWLTGQFEAGKKYLASDANFDIWKRKPGVALISYAQLQRAFGWEPFTTVFRIYETMDRAERPSNNQEKMDQWVFQMSLSTRHDLRPFYASWGMPLSKELLDDNALDALPKWFPPPL